MSRDRSWNDGDKLSFSERDRLRREGRRDDTPEGVSDAQRQQASDRYRKKLDGLFSKPASDAGSLAAALRAAHGSDRLPDACREYLAAAGYPSDPGLIGIFLDSGDSELMVGVLEALLAVASSGDVVETTGGLRSQLRMLVDGRDSVVAGLCEDLLAAL